MNEINRKKRDLRVLLIAVGAFTACAIFFAGLIMYLVQKDSVTSTRNELNSMIADTNKRVATIQKEKVIVDDMGKPSEQLKKMDSYVKNLFTRVTTYDSGQKYVDNRRFAKTHIQDERFFKQVMGDPIDSYGDNRVDVLSMKSKTDTVQIYQYGKERYYVIIRYIPYTKSETINAPKYVTDSLKRHTLALRIKGTPTTGLTEVEPIRDFDSM